MPSEKDRVINGYAIGAYLGEGSHAVVKRGTHIEKKESCAVKIIDKTKLSPTEAALLYNERTALLRLNHHGIPKLLSLYEEGVTCYQFLELIDGPNLFTFLERHGQGLPEQCAKRLFLAMLSVLEHCHLKGVVHRDIKLENWMLKKKPKAKVRASVSENFTPVLIDFGLCEIFEDGDIDTLLQQPCGSPHYAAPELMQAKQYKGVQIDIWSLGVVLYAMLEGSLPFLGDTWEELAYNICNRNIRDLPHHLTPMACDLLSQMMAKDPEARPSIAQIRKHPWVADVLVSPSSWWRRIKGVFKSASQTIEC